MDDLAELKAKTSRCYVCGADNASGLHIPFRPDGDNGSRAVYTAKEEHQGWPGVLHGGLAFSLMDEALAWALYFHGLTGVTARVEARFRQPIRIGTSMEVRAWMVKRQRKIVTARAELRSTGDGNPLLAEADATMYLLEGIEGEDVG